MAPDLPASRHPPEKQDDVAVPSPPQLFFCDESLCTSAHGDCCAPTHGQCDDSLCTSAGGDCCAPNGEEGTCSGGFVPVRTYETCQNWIGARTRAALARRRPAAAGLCPCVQGMIARTISRESTRAARRPRRRTRHPVLIPRHPLGRGSRRPTPAPLPRPPLLCRRPSPSPVQIVT